MSPPLLQALAPDGPLRGVISWRNADPGLRDVQLRREPKGTASWVSLYLGLTSVLDVYEEDGRAASTRTGPTKKRPSVGNIAVPDLSGQRLSDVVETLEALGLHVLYEDQRKADGTRRTVMTKRNWRVVNQQVFPAASSNDVPTVRLIVLNQSD